MPNYILPQVLVFQEFASQPVALDRKLLACIVGEQFDLHRYIDVDEKAGIASGAYDPASEQCILWPARAPGTVVDPTYSKVFFDNALLEYFNDPVGGSSDIGFVTPGRNKIRATNTIWKTGNGEVRDTALLRDVTAGDVVRLIGSSCGAPETFESSVIDFVADTVPSVIDDVVIDVSNQDTTVLSSSNTQTEGSVNEIEIFSEDPSTYNGLDDGNPTEVYTIEVVTAGEPGVAIFRILSQSGNDDMGLVTFDGTFGNPFDIGTRGLTVTFDTTGVGVDTPLDTFIVGQKWEVNVSQAFTAPTALTVLEAGTYTGDSNTSYIVTVSRGGKYTDTVKPQIVVSTTTGVDISGPTNVPSVSPVAVGTEGVTIAFTVTSSLCKGDRYIIPVTAAAPGAIKTLVLANNLTDGLRGICPLITGLTGDTATSTLISDIADTSDLFVGQGVSGSGIVSGSVIVSIVPNTSITISIATTSTINDNPLTFGGQGTIPDLDVTLFIKKNIEVPEIGASSFVNWTQTATELCLQPDIKGYDSSWQSGGILQPLPVDIGTIYLQHRDRVSTNSNTVGTISDVGEVGILGKNHPDNPLAFGVYNALLNANGEDVKYLSVVSINTSAVLDLDDWLIALDKLTDRDDVYSLVPLTQDKQIADAFVAHCDSQSSPENGRWRIAWINLSATEVIPVYTTSTDSTDPLLATITDDTDTSGNQYTIVEAVGEKFVTAGVRANDTVRALYTTDGFGNTVYTEFVIDAVLNEESFRLVSGPDDPVNIASKIEIYRTLTKTELANDLAQKPGLFANRRARLVWPDVLGNAGVTFPGFHLCSALAGLRSGVLPHQGLTNIEIAGFDDVSRTVDYFSTSQLNAMAASGYWIVTQDPNNGTIFSRHQLTTGDQSSINTREDSKTTNLDHISFVYLDSLKAYIGQGNVVPTMIDIIRGEIISITENFKNNILVDRLGPQILEGKIRELRQHPTFKDRVLCIMDLDLPGPLNNIELHLVS